MQCQGTDPFGRRVGDPSLCFLSLSELFGFIRTFGDQVSILKYLQPVSAKLKIAPKSLTRSGLFDSGFTKSADEPLFGIVSSTVFGTVRISETSLSGLLTNKTLSVNTAALSAAASDAVLAMSENHGISRRFIRVESLLKNTDHARNCAA
jgi:hypothetical protein